MGIISEFLVSQAKSRLFTPDFSSSDNQIEGLRHDGVSWRIRRALTDFGSGYQGPKHPSFEEGLIGPGSISPGDKQPNLTFQWLEHGSVRHEAEDFSSSLPYYLLPEAEKIARSTTHRVLPFLERNWKAVSAVGLLGLFAIKPLSLFSGRDDESNTLEGLRHGGLSQRMRRDMTPFGSGWDPMRALAREAGLSLEKFVAQPHMKLAMASGDVLRELGQGTFGKVHLMESSVKIGEKEHTFQYARKSVMEGDRTEMFHEVKNQRRLQDLNSPSVYGWSGNQIYMEPMEGRGAYAHMRSGQALPESFISDLEKFIPEMHNRGIAHMDMTRDVNRLLSKSGPSGEIVPHNIILTKEGRAGVIDYGMSMRSGSSSKTIHKMYNHTSYSTNAELDMSLVKSLRANKGKLTDSTIQEFNKSGRSTPIVAPPSAKTIRAKVRANTQSIATKKTAKNMFRVGTGRNSRSAFSSTNKV